MIDALLASTPPAERPALEAQLRQMAQNYERYPANAVPRLAMEARRRYAG